jgi:MoxR-like ATPase
VRDYQERISEERANELDQASAGLYPNSEHPRNYVPSKELASAVNVAIVLRRPLLLTGAPGTGKSSVAHSVAWQLKMGKPLEFVVKSDTQASDLFYTFDAIGRFAAEKDEKDPVRHIDYQALGKAILYSNDIESPSFKGMLLNQHINKAKQKDGDNWSKQRRSVVLIDEIDKAQRDVPNDILVEIERREFSIKELGYKSITCADRFEPVVIITSNSERALPDAFLRRCVYFHVNFPGDDILKSIVAGRLGDRFSNTDHPVLKDAVSLFNHLRNSNLAKKPGTAELLDCLSVLFKENKLVPDEAIDFSSPEVLEKVKVCLLKTKVDQESTSSLVDAWVDARSSENSA